MARIGPAPAFQVELDSALGSFPDEDMIVRVARSGDGAAASGEHAGPACALRDMRRVPGEVSDYAQVRNRVADAVQLAAQTAVHQAALACDADEDADRRRV